VCFTTHMIRFLYTHFVSCCYEGWMAQHGMRDTYDQGMRLG